MASSKARPRATPVGARPSGARRKSIVGGFKAGKETGPSKCQDLRLNNRELARRLEYIEQNLEIAHRRIVDLQAENSKLNEQLVLADAERRSIQAKLDLEQGRSESNSRFFTSLKASLDDHLCSLGSSRMPPRTAGRGVSAKSRTSRVLKDSTNATRRKQSAKAKVQMVRATREELNVRTLTHTPIAHQPGTADIAEGDEQCVTPAVLESCSLPAASSASGRSSTETDWSRTAADVSYAQFSSPTLPSRPVSSQAESSFTQGELSVQSHDVMQSHDVIAESTSGSQSRLEAVSMPPSQTSSPISNDRSQTTSQLSTSSACSPFSEPAVDMTTIGESGTTLEQDGGDDFIVAEGLPDCFKTPRLDLRPAEEGVRARRRRSISSYAEPPLRKKLRSGDPYTENNPHWDGHPQSATKKPTPRTRRQSFRMAPPAAAPMEDF